MDFSCWSHSLLLRKGRLGPEASQRVSYANSHPQEWCAPNSNVLSPMSIVTIFSELRTQACNLTKDFDVATSRYKGKSDRWKNKQQNIESSWSFWGLTGTTGQNNWKECRSLIATLGFLSSSADWIPCLWFWPSMHSTNSPWGSLKATLPKKLGLDKQHCPLRNKLLFF